MKKFELSLSSDYVPKWTIVDAVRELFQNAIDQEAQDSDNEWSWYFSDGTLRLNNRRSLLTTRSLLLGATTKANDTKTIGQFGEGYKVATLVLLRNGKQVTIYNYGKREVWTTKLVASRRYGADVLTFFIDAKYPWTQLPDNDLTVEVTGITDEEWSDIVKSNLYLRSDYEVIASTDFGDILDIPGQVFVNGLFVCNYPNYKHSYNFRPGCLKLDRDRKLASDFDLQWLASKAWCMTSGLEVRLYELMRDNAADVLYVADNTYISKSRDAITSYAHSTFVAEHGDKAVPITNQTGLLSVPAGYTAVIVPETLHRTIKQSSTYVDPPEVASDPTPLDRLQDWFDSYKDLLPEAAVLELQSIIDDMEA